jgi:hypothetical protein
VCLFVVALYNNENKHEKLNIIIIKNEEYLSKAKQIEINANVMNTFMLLKNVIKKRKKKETIYISGTAGF